MVFRLGGLVGYNFWSWRRCIRTLCPLKCNGYLAILSGDVAYCWQEGEAFIWDNAKFSFAVALHGCGWVPNSGFSIETLPLDEMPAPLCEKNLEIGDHCLEYPERWIDNNETMTKTRIAEVVQQGTIEPSWDDEEVQFRLHHKYEGDCVITDIDGSHAITWIPQYHRTPEFRVRNIPTFPMQDMITFQKKIAVQHYNAQEHNGRGGRALGYLLVNAGECLFCSHVYAAEPYNRYHSYVYACSRCGQGWVPAEVVQSLDNLVEDGIYEMCS